jgi:prepilin-type N-terminal cleavage/methylation domain-containing protein
MRSTNRNQASRGFTLIEAMIASVVLAFCVVGVCGLLVSAMQNQAATEARSTAAAAAVAGMESLAAKHLDDISARTGVAMSESIDPSLMRDASDAEMAGRVKYLRRTAGQVARDIAVIEVTAETADGQTVTLYRLATRAEMP